MAGHGHGLRNSIFAASCFVAGLCIVTWTGTLAGRMCVRVGSLGLLYVDSGRLEACSARGRTVWPDEYLDPNGIASDGTPQPVVTVGEPLPLQWRAHATFRDPVTVSIPLWIPIGMFTSLSILARPRRPDAASCPRCGYTIVGLPSSRCPECGALEARRAP